MIIGGKSMSTRKRITVLTMLILVLTLLAGCGSSSSERNLDKKTEKKALSGEKLVRERCTGCHKFQGVGVKKGPELSHATLKQMKVKDLSNFLHAPANVGKNMPTPDLSEEEILAIATYLVDLSTTQGKARVPDATEGEVVFAAVCIGCHKFGAEGGKAGPELTGIGKKYKKEEIKKFIMEPTGSNPEAIMPKLGLTPEVTDQIVAYLISGPKPGKIKNNRKPSIDLPKTLDGKEPAQVAMVLEKYKCRLCHVINGTGGKIGPDLTKLAEYKAASWVARYLRDPQATQPGTKMSNLGLTGEEIELLVNYLHKK